MDGSLPDSFGAALLEPTPCDHCPLWERCAAERLACRAFVAFVHRGTGVRWQTRTRKPTRKLYAAAMGADPRAVQC